eukprot:gene7053-biopygen2496
MNSCHEGSVCDRNRSWNRLEGTKSTQIDQYRHTPPLKNNRKYFTQCKARLGPQMGTDVHINDSLHFSTEDRQLRFQLDSGCGHCCSGIDVSS